MQFQKKLNKCIIFLAISILFLFDSSISFARCPIHALNVNVFLNSKFEDRKVYVEVTDKFRTQKVELQLTNNGSYHGLVGFSTVGFVLLVEWTCSYLPKYLTIYIGDEKENIKLDWESLKKRKRAGDSPYVYIFDVEIIRREPVGNK